MKTKPKMLFIKQDILKISTFILLFLSLLSGFAVIYSREYLSRPFQVENIYAMFTTFSEFLLMFLAVNLFGKEFQNRTINMIRISGRTSWEIILRKLLVMIVGSVIPALLVGGEVLFDQLVYNHSEVDLLRVFGQLILSYTIYSLFLFSIGSLIVFWLKNTLFAFISLLLFLRIGVTAMNVLGNFKQTIHVIEYIPLSFAENSFYFANYTLKQFIVMTVWSFALLVVLPIAFKGRGYK